MMMVGSGRGVAAGAAGRAAGGGTRMDMMGTGAGAAAGMDGRSSQEGTGGKGQGAKAPESWVGQEAVPLQAGGGRQAAPPPPSAREARPGAAWARMLCHSRALAAGHSWRTASLPPATPAWRRCAARALYCAGWQDCASPSFLPAVCMPAVQRRSMTDRALHAAPSSCLTATWQLPPHCHRPSRRSCRPWA